MTRPSRHFTWLAAAALAAAAPAIAQPPGLVPPKAAPVDPDEARDEARQLERERSKPAPDPDLPPMTLGECLATAYTDRPAIHAAQFSLLAAQRGEQALNNLGGLAERLSPDLPIRRQQASSGVMVATADLQKVMQEATQDVMFTYYSYVYALQQEQTANRVLEQLEIYYDAAEEIVRAGVLDPRLKIDQFTLYRLRNTIGEVRQLRTKATAGKRLALEGLKQAMGVDPSREFAPATKEMPLMLGGSVTKEQVVADALGRRPELTQAASGVDAFRLEVCAQAKLKYRPQAQTLAAGSDLHARVFPAAVRNGEYKPGALAPEMPGNLVGKTADRVARAEALSLRQDALYEETVGLIKLEAAKAFHNWESATERVKEAKNKFETARKLVEESRAAAIARQDPDLLVQNEALAGKAQSDYVEAVYEHIKSLAALERVTGGAVRVAFPGR